MNYLYAATFFLLLIFLYIQKDIFIFGKRRLEFLFISILSIMFALFLITGFLAEFIGIFIFLFAIFLVIGSLGKLKRYN